MKEKVLGKHDTSEAQILRKITAWALVEVIAGIMIGLYFTIGTAEVVLPFFIGLPLAWVLARNIQFLQKK